jgi:hypothetical protein
MRACSVGFAMCAISRLAMAQAPQTIAMSPPTPPIGAWAALTLGPGTATNRNVTLFAGQLGGYVSVGTWVAGYRRGGASGIDSDGAYDDAVLVGRRVTDMLTTGFAAVGVSRVYDAFTGRGTLGIGFSAEAGGNLRVVGLGASVFGAFTPRLSYVGIGLTLDAGWIR